MSTGSHKSHISCLTNWSLLANLPQYTSRLGVSVCGWVCACTHMGWDRTRKDRKLKKEGHLGQSKLGFNSWILIWNTSVGQQCYCYGNNIIYKRKKGSFMLTISLYFYWVVNHIKWRDTCGFGLHGCLPLIRTNAAILAIPIGQIKVTFSDKIIYWTICWQEKAPSAFPIICTPSDWCVYQCVCVCKCVQVRIEDEGSSNVTGE